MQGCSCWVRVGDAKLNFEHGGKNIILTSIAEVGFTKGGEKRGKAQESASRWAVICDVFWDL